MTLLFQKEGGKQERVVRTMRNRRKGKMRLFSHPFLVSSLLLSYSVLCLAAPGWTWRHFYVVNKGITNRKSITSTRPSSQKKASRGPIESLASGNVRQGPRILHHAIYWLTAADAIQCVFLNKYSNLIKFATSGKSNPSSFLMFWAGIRPRFLYAVGALLRALQLCTPIRRVLDPSIGVGAGVNLCAIIAGCRWVNPVILGWATTKWTWTWFGARQVPNAYLPITLSLREWEELKPKKGKEENC